MRHLNCFGRRVIHVYAADRGLGNHLEFTWSLNAIGFSSKLPESQLHLRLVHRRGGADTDRLLTFRPSLLTILQQDGADFTRWFQRFFRFDAYK